MAASVAVPPPIGFAIRVAQHVSANGAVGYRVGHIGIIAVVRLNVAVGIEHIGLCACALVQYERLCKIAWQFALRHLGGVIVDNLFGKQVKFAFEQ